MHTIGDSIRDQFGLTVRRGGDSIRNKKTEDQSRGQGRRPGEARLGGVKGDEKQGGNSKLDIRASSSI